LIDQLNSIVFSVLSEAAAALTESGRRHGVMIAEEGTISKGNVACLRRWRGGIATDKRPLPLRVTLAFPPSAGRLLASYRKGMGGQVC